MIDFVVLGDVCGNKNIRNGLHTAVFDGDRNCLREHKRCRIL